MEQIKNSPFKLDSFTIIESHIVRNPEDLGEVDVDIHPIGLLNRKNQTFNLALEVEVKDAASLSITVKCMGSFKFKAEIPESDMNNYFLVNAPAIVFPYLRSYISALTALSGLSAINLPVMNLSSLKELLRKNITDITPKAKVASKKKIKSDNIN